MVHLNICCFCVVLVVMFICVILLVGLFSTRQNSHCSMFSEFGSTRVGEEAGLLQIVLQCVASTQWCVPADHRFDLLVLVCTAVGGRRLKVC